MTDLQNMAREFVALRRSLGYKLAMVEARLNEFVTFLESKGAAYVTTQLALAWVLESARGAIGSYKYRLYVVRSFAKYLSATDSRNEVPPPRLLPPPARTRRPYIYTEKEVLALMKATQMLSSTEELRCHTYYCVLGLLAVTGLRSGEALRLRKEDVDLTQGLLTIRETKFGKSRLIPLHATTVKALTDYSARRDAFLGKAKVDTFFASQRRGPLSTFQLTFVTLRRAVGLGSAPGRENPRLHDFRHRFAVNTLLKWYRDGENVERLLPVLSTFLGHTRIEDTYWYLSSTPELMKAASERLEKRWEGSR
jgi:integrase